MIIWITGISGAGKTTIAKALIKKLKPKISNLVNVDGDEIRELFEEDLGYSEKDRIIQINRIQRLCLLLEKQDQVVIASALYSNEKLLNWNKNNFKNYYEIYVEASIDLVSKGDIKGLYKKALSGEEKNVVGIDIPWNVPKKYHLIIKRDTEISVKETINRIIDTIPILKNKYRL